MKASVSETSPKETAMKLAAVLPVAVGSTWLDIAKLDLWECDDTCSDVTAALAEGLKLLRALPDVTIGLAKSDLILASLLEARVKRLLDKNQYIVGLLFATVSQFLRTVSQMSRMYESTCGLDWAEQAEVQYWEESYGDVTRRVLRPIAYPLPLTVEELAKAYSEDCKVEYTEEDGTKETFTFPSATKTLRISYTANNMRWLRRTRV